MGLEQNSFGTYYLAGDYETKADHAGGTNGFPLIDMKKLRARKKAQHEEVARRRQAQPN